MPSLKRKRPHDTAPAVKAPRAEGASPPQLKATSRPTSTVTRRATRRTSDADPPPIPWAADPEPRRRRKSIVIHERLDDRHIGDDHAEQKPDVLVKQDASSRNRGGEPEPVFVPAATGKRGRPPSAPEKHHRPVLRTTNQADPALVPKPVIRNKAIRRSQHDDAHFRDQNPRDGDTNDPVAPIQLEAPSIPLRRPASAVGPPQPFPKPTRTHHQSVPASIAPMMTQAQPRPVKTSDHVAANTSKPVLPTVTISNTTQSPPRHAKKQTPAKQNSDQRRPGIIDRNIDKVVFGNVCFSTWYHSPYGTEAFGEISGNSTSANGVIGIQDGGNKEEALSNPNRKTKEERLDRLYVCPSCFKYSKELVPWWQHVHQCERKGYVPGRKIYTHPQRPTRSAPTSGGAVAPTAGTKGSGRKRKASDAASYSFEEEAEDQGEWSIWEVDGEEEGLFCQNLSLFAKLFLDNKSVFFDVVGFKYFLLVHKTPRAPLEDGTNLPPKRQVVGFFSKEKLSWDNNNLACILVFPPWQRKGLGALLMGVSYEISRREGMLGGPEKPISDLGKKGYKRFWAGEVAAWLLGLDTNGDDEVVVDVDECSKATWIVPEDCLMVLREMGVIEEAEAGPPKKKRPTVTPSEEAEESGVAAVQEEVEEEVQNVPRVQLRKEAVLAWVRANRIPLEPACDPDGFVEGYAIKQTGIEEDEEE